MEEKKPDFGFNVLRILDCGFQFEEAIEPDPDNTLISYTMGFHFHVDESWVIFNLRADFVKKQKEVFAFGAVLTKFGIQNLKAFTDKNGDVSWPPNSLESMFGIAFSHLRAIVSKNFAGTAFSNFLIPLINPTYMFNELIKRDPIYNAERLPLKQEDKQDIPDIFMATKGKATKRTKRIVK